VYKTIMLGVLYGLSGRGAARRLDIPTCDGEELLRHHRRVFPRFWEWSDAVENHALLHGWLATCFQWPLHVTADTTSRGVRNFLMQSNGAEMLRIATGLAVHRGLPVCALIHDALLVEGSSGDIDDVVTETRRAMEDASLAILPGFPLRTDTTDKTVVRYPDRYRDDRGAEVWRVVEAWIQRLEDRATSLEEGDDEVPF
jgi:DNA polymerase I-like protein with 3'-5' exonuclease and polymerase domains